jgi:hypothetical protein
MLLIVVALVSLLITRVATIALTVTGLTRTSARFQARSALSGVGFTTSESEAVVNHPARRRVVMALMLLGNAGLVTAVAGLLAGFAGADAGEGALRVVLLLGGLAVIYALSRSEVVDRHLSRLIGKVLNRYTDLDVADYERLLQLSGEYSVKEIPVETGSWLADRPLGELRLRDEGVIVLGVGRPDGSYIGVPRGETYLRPGDTVIVYGRDSAVLGLMQRDAGREGDRMHEQAVLDQREVARQEHARDPGALG